MNPFRLILLTICLSLVLVSTAQAAPHHHHHQRIAMIRFPTVKAPKAIMASMASGPTAVGMGNVGSLGCQNLPLQGDSLVRIVEGYTDDPARWLQCAQDAHQAGYRVALAVQYNNLWSIAQDRAWFSQIIGLYAPYAWAVSIGNEQELGNAVAETAQRYSQTWRALEPILAHVAPQAIRVAGEISPWGLNFLEAAARDGLPGAQAYSAHPYPVAGALDPAVFAQFAAANHVQAWATEGMCGPGALASLGCRSSSELHRDGYAAAFEWYVTDSSDAATQAPSDPVGQPLTTA
jgi:hypothetical protein